MVVIEMQLRNGGEAALRARLLAATSTQSLAELLGLPERGLGLAELWEAALLAPTREFIGRPAKAFRAALVRCGWSLAGGAAAPPLELECLVELLHAGSLVVDDVQDRATLRRGGPALHRQIGAGLAINCGNWLYFLAIRQIAHCGLDDSTQLRLHRRLTDGVLGCHHGQALDLYARIDSLPQQHVTDVVRAASELKSGSLTGLAASTGALAAGACDDSANQLDRYGRQLGVGLQMLNDLRDIASDTCHLDLSGGRPTWVWAWLAELLPTADYDELRRRAASARHDPATAAGLASELAQRLGEHGRERARLCFDDALALLATRFGAAAIQPLCQQVAKLQEAYCG
jgi:geranylgeranyl pyrophosphate synthase